MVKLVQEKLLQWKVLIVIIEVKKEVLFLDLVKKYSISLKNAQNKKLSLW